LLQAIPRNFTAHQGHELVFGKMVFGEYGIEEDAIEMTVGRPEFRVVSDGIADHLVRDLEL